MNVEELAWAAGFFDGEGSITAKRVKRASVYRYFRATVVQTDRRVLDRFVVATGTHRPVTGPHHPPSRNERTSPQYIVDALGYPAEAMIAGLWAWLSEPKREQAMRVLEICAPSWGRRTTSPLLERIQHEETLVDVLQF